MGVYKWLVVIERVVVWLVLVDEPDDDDDDDVMNDTIVPNDDRLWVKFALLRNFDTLVDDPKHTAYQKKKSKLIGQNKIQKEKVSDKTRIHHYAFQIGR